MLTPYARHRERDQWLTALLTALLLLAVSFAFCRLIYETNDDSSIVAAASGAVTGAPYAGNGFTSYLYGALLSGLFSICPSLPWHALFMLCVAALSLTAIVKCFLLAAQRQRVPRFALWGVFFALYFGVLLPYVVMLQFTTVSAMAACAGLCLTLCARYAGPRAARFARAAAALLLLCSFGLRVQTLWVSMPLIAAYGALAWIESPKEGRGTAVTCGLFILLLGLLSLGDHALYRHFEPNWDGFVLFNEQLSGLLDYNNTDIVNALAWDAAGWPEWTTYMVRGWYQLDERMTLESLTSLMNAVKAAKPPPTAGSLIRSTGSVMLRYPMFSFTLAGFVLLALWAGVRLALRRRFLDCLRIAGAFAYLAVFIGYFYGVLGRLPERAAFAAACPCYALVALCCLKAFRPSLDPLPQARFKKRAASLAVTASLALLTFVPNALYAQDRLPLRWQAQSRDAARALSGRMCAYAVEHPDRVFVTDAPLDHGPLYVYGDALPVNLIEWCNGMFHSPMYREKLRVLGFESFTSQTLLDERVRLLLSGEGVLDNLTGYMEAEYGPVTAEILHFGDGFLECRFLPDKQALAEPES